MINPEIILLIETSRRIENVSTSLNALGDLGLLIERHTQSRYKEAQYLQLLGKNQTLFELRLTQKDVNIIVDYFFYHLLNYPVNLVNAAWCLGKCYNQDIRNGMHNLFQVFQERDDVTLQLIYSYSALFGLEHLKTQLFELKGRLDMPETSAFLRELEDEGFFGSILN